VAVKLAVVDEDSLIVRAFILNQDLLGVIYYCETRENREDERYLLIR
jgi:hypothetical protein